MLAEVFGQSICTRCGDVIETEQLEQFLRDDHLCVGCRDVSDVEHALKVKATERQSRVRPENR